MIFGILCLLFVSTDASLSAQFKMLRGHANNYSVEDIKREEDLEYPGNNRRILSLIQDMWEKYYLCLIRREYQDKKPEIRRLLEGQYTELECDICPRPFQRYEDIEWRYKPLTPDTEIQELQYLDLTPEMTYADNKTIRIYNAVEALAGLYVCFLNRDPVSVYILEVSKNDTTERVDTYSDAEEHFIQSEGVEFQVSYRWTGWTECSACGRVGKKYRYGTCYVSSLKQGNDECKCKTDKTRRSTNQTEKHSCVRIGSKEDLSQKENNTGKQQIVPECDNDDDWNLEILEKFSTGIPCASQYLPRSVAGTVKHFKSVNVLVKFCWEACRETEIFQVYDSNNKLIEYANNTAGIYSVFQKLPRLPHDIERRTIAADFGTDIIIQCPGTSFTNTPVVWKINKQIIFPELVAVESKGRFTIDLVNRINLKKLRLRDSRIYRNVLYDDFIMKCTEYCSPERQELFSVLGVILGRPLQEKLLERAKPFFSCWQKEKLVGTVNLNVEKKFKIVFDHHVILIMIIAVSGMLLFIGSKMVGREFRKWKK